MCFNKRCLLIIFASLGIGFASISANSGIVVSDSPPAEPGDAHTGFSLTEIQRFASVITQIHQYYVEPIDNKKLFEYAISGMLSNLDPHSDYLNEDALKDLETTTTGKFGGIGIEILPSDGFIKVVSPIDETPAFRAGVKAGDFIVRINSKLVRDMTMGEAIEMIRGDVGTTVHLTILRKDQKRPLELNVTREIIKYHTVKTELWPSGYGYIRLSFFQSATRADLVKGIKRLQHQARAPLKGVILDLRNNPGGLLDSAVDVTELFLDSRHLKYGGLIVYTKGRVSTSNIKATAGGSDLLTGTPLVVLINEGSASAAEIVAGALQDQQRAILVGQKSFGKGSVQTILGIDDKSAIKLTTALYYTPAGRSIQAQGIMPDIQIPEITIPKPVVTEDETVSISEADLGKHLLNEGNTSSAKYKETALEVKKNQDLLYSDFVLYQAMNILKGLKAGVSMY